MSAETQVEQKLTQADRDRLTQAAMEAIHAAVANTRTVYDESTVAEMNETWERDKAAFDELLRVIYAT